MTFTSDRSGVINIYKKRADDIGEAESLFPSENSHAGGSWLKDGTLFAFYENHPNTGMDIWIYTTKDSTARPFLNIPDNEFGPAILPDGKWIAYLSDRTGQIEMYIKP